MGVKEVRFSGQMTVEFVVAFPAMIAIALIAVNAGLFFSDCASFDRLFRSSVCTYAASPAYEQGLEQSCSLVEGAIGDAMGRENLQFTVDSSGSGEGTVTFTGVMRFQPTLFGKGNLSGAFGVSFPALSHEEKISVCVYKPGLVV